MKRAIFKNKLPIVLNVRPPSMKLVASSSRCKGYLDNVSARSRRRRRRSILPISAGVGSVGGAVVRMFLEPEAEGDCSLSWVSTSGGRRDVKRSAIYSGSFLRKRPMNWGSKERRHSPRRASMMGSRPGGLAGSFSKSSRPPVLARHNTLHCRKSFTTAHRSTTFQIRFKLTRRYAGFQSRRRDAAFRPPRGRAGPSSGSRPSCTAVAA
jgi:hypothetical protein